MPSKHQLLATDAAFPITPLGAAETLALRLISIPLQAITSADLLTPGALMIQTPSRVPFLRSGAIAIPEEHKDAVDELMKEHCGGPAGISGTEG